MANQSNPLNRTSVELKFQHSRERERTAATLNRTSVELKYSTWELAQSFGIDS